MTTLPFKITTLLFIQDPDDRFLLIRRTKAPNKDTWSPPGGKLEMALGESPFECAIREAAEETGLHLHRADLHLWGMVSEKGYEGTGHWLMFCFQVHPRLDRIPPTLAEGHFAFFSREAIRTLDIPPSDHQVVWPFYDRYHRGFVAYRVECRPDGNLEIEVEQTLS